MNIYSKGAQDELKELMQLIKLHERFVAVVAHGTLPPDEKSIISHHCWILRIDEISQKYGLQ